MGFTARSLPGASGLGRDGQPCRPVQPPNPSVSQNPSCLPNPLQFPNLSCPKPPIRSAAARRGSTRLCLSPVLGMLCTPGDGLTPKGGRGRTILRPPTRCLSLPSTRVNGQWQTGEGSSERLWGAPLPTHPRAAAGRGFAARTGAELLPRPSVLPKLWEGKGEAGQEMEASGWLTLWCLLGAGGGRQSCRASPPAGITLPRPHRASLLGRPAPKGCSGLGMGSGSASSPVR